MDCQGLVVRLIQDFVLLTTAVEVAQRWRELAEKLAKVSKQQMDAYESPHRDRNGVVDSEVSVGCDTQSRRHPPDSAFVGRSELMRESTWRALPAWGRPHPPPPGQLVLTVAGPLCPEEGSQSGLSRNARPCRS